jgi:hypothetical protein
MHQDDGFCYLVCRWNKKYDDPHAPTATKLIEVAREALPYLKKVDRLPKWYKMPRTGDYRIGLFAGDSDGEDDL